MRRKKGREIYPINEFAFHGLSNSSVSLYKGIIIRFQKSKLSPSDFIQSAHRRSTAKVRVAALTRLLGRTIDCKLPAQKKRLPVFLSSTEINQLIVKLQGNKKILLATLYYTGMRISEALSVRKEDAWQSITSGFLKINGKGDRERVITIPERLKKIWKGDKVNSPYLLHDAEGNQLNLRTAQRWISSLSAEEGKAISPHCIRHSFAVALLEQQAPLFYIKEKLGHASINTTQIYLHLRDSFEKKLDKRYLNNL